MSVTANTVLVTGGGSGIGRGLAETLHRAGNQVVIAGRRQAPLQAVADANPGIACRHLDLADPDSITRLAAELTDTHPGLNVLVNNAGVMHTEDLRTGAAATAEIAQTTVAINLLGPIRLTAALLPALLARPQAAIVNVTSALAFVPKAAAPTYSATKAGLHAYTQSLRRQLRRTSVKVIEIIPPRVETDMLAGQDDGTDAMSLDAFVAETISLLHSQPDAEEVVVHAAKRVRFAARDGHYDDIFDAVNP
ncbi:SDR family oxidoreductase [Mycolicibacterium brisbanense]|uniref:DltE protein n=1 Tax=Mycolicibacterium brisbanense TaxID=146020 RepID=A0A100W0Q9_9MYCO|nr:SDR family NAD(P)-dependent oxidoreductase [Mycolicibacterium brisbanense]MCV7155905.1 SDR family oxidoreductase [Mycolicibacterium brisbanense]GAS89517.1 DltE protein [Mycolicibacterium brisbanense]